MQDEGSMGPFAQKQGRPVGEGSWGGEEAWEAGAGPGLSSWRGTWVFFMSKGVRGSRGVIWDRPKQGQKVCFTLKKKRSGCCPENVPEPGPRWGASLGAGGKGPGRSCALLTFAVLAAGSELSGDPSVRRGASHVGRTSALGTRLSPFAFWSHSFEICGAEPGGTAGPPGVWGPRGL